MHSVHSMDFIGQCPYFQLYVILMRITEDLKKKYHQMSHTIHYSYY